MIDPVANDSPQMIVDAEERQVVLHLLGAVDEPVEVRLPLRLDAAEAATR